MEHLTRMLILLLAVVACAGAASGAEEAKPWLKPDPGALQRWQEMRFGMFIHWGPVSLTGHEIGWSRGAQTPIEEYDGLYKRFNPAKFNADEWVATAKAAGMKYVVLTTKHHDGFCIFNTKATDFNIMNSPFKRDVTGELAAACKRAGIAFGTYHSVCDWHHPDFPVTSPGGTVKREKSDIESYTRYLETQTAELIKQYGPLLVMWFDVPQFFDRERGERMIKHVRTLQPDIVINNRSGAGGDFDTPEQRVGKFQNTRPWETCMTICRQWAWMPNDKMKSLQECLRTLILSAGGDGNLLFNVGPTADGVIEERQVARLKEMGEWLGQYGESIYGTRGGPWKPCRTHASTRKGDTVYLHVFEWEGDALALPPLPRKIVEATVLTGGTAAVKQDEKGVVLSVPPASRQAIDTLIKLRLDGSAMEIEPMKSGDDSGDVVVKLPGGMVLKASNMYGNDPDWGPDKALDGNPATRWATDGGTAKAWLEVDYGRALTFDRVLITEACGSRVKSFELLWQDGETWKPFHTGTAIGEKLEAQFAPVTTRKVRLNILDASEGPTFWEFRMLEAGK